MALTSRSLVHPSNVKGKDVTAHALYRDEKLKVKDGRIELPVLEAYDTKSSSSMTVSRGRLLEVAYYWDAMGS